MPKVATVEDLASWRREAEAKRSAAQRVVAICGDTGCRTPGSLQVMQAFEQQIERQGLSDLVTVRLTGCLGFCEQGPVVVIEPGGIFYCRVTPEDVGEIVAVTRPCRRIPS